MTRSFKRLLVAGAAGFIGSNFVRRLRRARPDTEITDVNNWYVERGEMQYDVVEGFWGDAGESIDAYYEVNDFVRRNRAEAATT